MDASSIYFALKKPFSILKKMKNLGDSAKWCTLRELLGTVREGSNAQVAEFIGDAEVVIFDFRT